MKLKFKYLIRGFRKTPEELLDEQEKLFYEQSSVNHTFLDFSSKPVYHIEEVKKILEDYKNLDKPELKDWL